MPPATDDTNACGFLEIAVEHGLLQPDRVEEIRQQAQALAVDLSDAALSLEAMQSWEVDAARLLLAPKQLAPGFELTGLIGCGAAGMVFRAHQAAMGRDVALKTINILGRNDTLGVGESRLKQEAKAIARLQHPNIVAAFDSGFHKGRYCIAMELVHGETLADFIARESPLSEDIVWQITRQVAAALCHGNEIGIIHRDIKPANLLLCAPPSGINHPNGVPFVKVVDFGLALDEFHSKDERLTMTGATLGTPAYVAPEQLESTSVDCRADIYALGATVFHMLGSAAPYADQSPMKAILQKTIGDNTWRTKLPEGISDPTMQLLLEMTEADVDKRIADYAQLLQRIDDLVNVRSSEARNVPTHSTAVIASSKEPTSFSVPLQSDATGAEDGTESSSQRRRWTTVVVGGTFLLATGLAGWLMPTLTELPNTSPEQTSAVDDAPAQQRWKTQGLSTPLFDGKSSFSPGMTQRGLWSVTPVPDGTPALIGTERSFQEIPLQMESGTSNVQLQAGIYLATESAAASVILRHTENGGNAKIDGTLHVTGDHTSYFEGAMADGLTAIETIEYSLAALDDCAFHTIEVRREDTRVTISVKGQRMAEFDVEPGQPASVIIRCVTGSIALADIKMFELVPEHQQ